jgi:hypothetical protein
VRLRGIPGGLSRGTDNLSTQTLQDVNLKRRVHETIRAFALRMAFLFQLERTFSWDIFSGKVMIMR